MAIYTYLDMYKRQGILPPKQQAIYSFLVDNNVREPMDAYEINKILDLKLSRNAVHKSIMSLLERRPGCVKFNGLTCEVCLPKTGL